MTLFSVIESFSLHSPDTKFVSLSVIVAFNINTIKILTTYQICISAKIQKLQNFNLNVFNILNFYNYKIIYTKKKANNVSFLFIYFAILSPHFI